MSAERFAYFRELSIEAENDRIQRFYGNPDRLRYRIVEGAWLGEDSRSLTDTSRYPRRSDAGKPLDQR